jgi:hypothetical protein
MPSCVSGGTSPWDLIWMVIELPGGAPAPARGLDQRRQSRRNAARVGWARATMALQARREALHVRRADRIVTTSRYSAERLVHSYGLDLPPTVIPRADRSGAMARGLSTGGRGSGCGPLCGPLRLQALPVKARGPAAESVCSAWGRCSSFTRPDRPSAPRGSLGWGEHIQRDLHPKSGVVRRHGAGKRPIAFFRTQHANVTVTRPAAGVGRPEDRIIVTVVYPVSP